MELLTRSTLKTFILSEVKAGRFVTVNFVKKDGSDRQLTVKASNLLKSEVQGDPTAAKATETLKARGMLRVCEMAAGKPQWRVVNLNTVYRVAARGTVYEVAD